MRISLSKIVLMVALACAASAHADTIQTFNFADVSFLDLGSQTGRSGSGSIDVNTTTGQATAINFTLMRSGSTVRFNSIRVQFTSLSSYLIDSYSGSDPLVTVPDFSLYLPVTTLLGYQGGAVCSTATLSQCSFVSVINTPDTNTFASGRLVPGAVTTTPVGTAVTPEPSSFALLMTGALGVTEAVRRRKLNRTN